MARDWTLWGQHPDYAGGVPIKVAAGTLSEVRTERHYREVEGGWSLTIGRTGAPRPWFPVEVAR